MRTSLRARSTRIAEMESSFGPRKYPARCECASAESRPETKSAEQKTFAVPATRQLSGESGGKPSFCWPNASAKGRQMKIVGIVRSICTSRSVIAPIILVSRWCLGLGRPQQPRSLPRFEQLRSLRKFGQLRQRAFTRKSFLAKLPSHFLASRGSWFDGVSRVLCITK